MITLSELESRIQTLVEDHLVNHLPGLKPEDRIAQKLASVMHSQIKIGEADDIFVPNMFIILSNPARPGNWQEDPRYLNELAHALEIAGAEAGIKFSARPMVTSSQDTTLPHNEIRILASFSPVSMGETRNMVVDTTGERNSNTIPGNSFLILEGAKVIPIDQAVINIGRRLDNQIVIDDPRISRSHAQIRAIKGRLVVFDLNSTGGSYVNGNRIHQAVLYPGDVISLAGVTLIFGQDLNTDQTDDKPTQPNTTTSTDQPDGIIQDEIKPPV